jgi:hypothetical protein
MVIVDLSAGPGEIPVMIQQFKTPQNLLLAAGNERANVR